MFALNLIVENSSSQPRVWALTEKDTQVLVITSVLILTVVLVVEHLI
jgi:hypothetical protein